EEIVLHEPDVPEALPGHEAVGCAEHGLVHVGPCYFSARSAPLAQDSQPAEPAAANIEGVSAEAVADLLEQSAPARLPDAGLKLKSLELRGLAGKQVVGIACACPRNRHLSVSLFDVRSSVDARRGAVFASGGQVRAWPVEAMPLRLLQQVQLVRPRHRRGARGAAGRGGDVAVRESLRDEAQDLDLAPGEDCVATDGASRLR